MRVAIPGPFWRALPQGIIHSLLLTASPAALSMEHMSSQVGVKQAPPPYKHLCILPLQRPIFPAWRSTNSSCLLGDRVSVFAAEARAESSLRDCQLTFRWVQIISRSLDITSAILTALGSESFPLISTLPNHGPAKHISCINHEVRVNASGYFYAFLWTFQ